MSLTVREGGVGSDPETKLADGNNGGKRASVRFRTSSKKLADRRLPVASYGRSFLRVGVNSLGDFNE